MRFLGYQNLHHGFDGDVRPSGANVRGFPVRDYRMSGAAAIYIRTNVSTSR